MTEDEQLIEAMARAMCMSEVGGVDSWPHEDEDVRSHYRDLARPALTTARVHWERRIRERLEWAKGTTDREFYEPYEAALNWVLNEPKPTEQETKNGGI